MLKHVILLMLDGQEHIGWWWIVRQVGCSSLKRDICEMSITYQDYQADDGHKFMDRIYHPVIENIEKTTPNLPHQEKRASAKRLTPLFDYEKNECIWSGRLDLNQRPPRPERGALPG